MKKSHLSVVAAEVEVTVDELIKKNESNAELSLLSIVALSCSFSKVITMRDRGSLVNPHHVLTVTSLNHGAV